MAENILSLAYKEACREDDLRTSIKTIGFVAFGSMKSARKSYTTPVSDSYSCSRRNDRFSRWRAASTIDSRRTRPTRSRTIPSRVVSSRVRTSAFATFLGSMRSWRSSTRRMAAGLEIFVSETEPTWSLSRALLKDSTQVLKQRQEMRIVYQIFRVKAGELPCFCT